jgi:hypothetical protein
MHSKVQTSRRDCILQVRRGRWHGTSIVPSCARVHSLRRLRARDVGAPRRQPPGLLIPCVPLALRCSLHLSLTLITLSLCRCPWGDRARGRSPATRCCRRSPRNGSSEATSAALLRQHYPSRYLPPARHSCPFGFCPSTQTCLKSAAARDVGLRSRF